MRRAGDVAAGCARFLAAVVVRDSSAPLGDLPGAERPHRLGRAAGIDEAAWHGLVRKHGRARLEHDVVLDDGAVEDHHVVANGDIAADRAGVHAGVAADAHAVADDAGEDLVVDVQRRPGAEVEVIADPDEMAIGAHDAERPQRGVGARA